MKEKKIKLYEYKELNDKAKEKAREWWSRGNDGSWAWENTVEDAKNIGLTIFSLDQHRANSGEFEISALDTAERIVKEHGENCETYKTASKYVKQLRQFSEDDTDETSVEYEALENVKHEFLHDLLEDYRIMLDKENEYQQSEEYISEIMEANEYEFDENGNRVQI